MLNGRLKNKTKLLKLSASYLQLARKQSICPAQFSHGVDFFCERARPYEMTAQKRHMWTCFLATRLTVEVLK